MTKDKTPEQLAALLKVAVLSEELRNARATAEAEIGELVRARIADEQRALEEAVMDALEDNSVTDVARAYTPPETTTPNRTAIYEIRNRLKDEPVVDVYPFEWVPRKIQTVNGPRTVYDIETPELFGFGPEGVVGTYRWTYLNGEVEPVLDPDHPPYPTSSFYRKALAQWLAGHPHPGGD